MFFGNFSFFKKILSHNQYLFSKSRQLYYTLDKYYVFFLSKIIKIYLKAFSKKNSIGRIRDNKSCGFIYIAFGENYFNEALKSAEILKEFSNYPIHIFTDQKDIGNYAKKIFSSISVVPITHKRSKVDYIHMSPFDNTIYLDSDIVVVDFIDDLFELLKKFDVLATLDTARKRENIAKKIKQYEEIPYAFGELNGGFLAFNKSIRDNVLNNWPNIFYKYFVETKGWDQPSLRILLWIHNVSLFILPPEYNVRSKDLLSKIKNNKVLLGKNHMKPRIYHMHANKDINEGNYIDFSKKEIVEIVKKRAYEINY